MSRLRSLVIIGAALAASTIGAVAADVPGSSPLPLPAPEVQPPPRVEIFSGWYLRGDLGYRWSQDSGVSPETGFPGPVSDSFSNTVVAGFGAGIKTDWLRADVTVDFATPMKYDGTIATPGDITAKVSATTALFNGYLDLGTWYRMTPYIGGGAGVAALHTYDYVSTLTPPFTAGLSYNQLNFAWAGMAGVAYTISSNMMVDIGYRYINFGDVATASDASGSFKFKNIAAHEVRVGLRWSFDDYPVVR